MDWSSISYAVCIIDDTGQIVARLEPRHDAEKLAGLLGQLKRIAPPVDPPIAIERPSVLIVDALVAAGHQGVPLALNVVRVCWPRYRAVGGKSDLGDAYMLADILRTNGYPFNMLMAATDDIRAMCVLVRRRDEKYLASFITQHAYCGHRSAAVLLARLRAAPTGLVSKAEANARGEIVRAFIAALGRLVPEITKLSSRIEHAVADLPAGKIVISFPRAGNICAAQSPSRTRQRARALPHRLRCY